MHHSLKVGSNFRDVKIWTYVSLRIDPVAAGRQLRFRLDFFPSSIQHPTLPFSWEQPPIHHFHKSTHWGSGSMEPGPKTRGVSKSKRWVVFQVLLHDTLSSLHYSQRPKGDAGDPPELRQVWSERIPSSTWGAKGCWEVDSPNPNFSLREQFVSWTWNQAPRQWELCQTPSSHQG